jgi:glycosyltransferase involved in cell wall biosynthesis
MNKRVLLVVHRMFPYPGGSEYYIGWMANEFERRGYEVCVLADTHKGDVGRVKVAHDYGILNQHWDLIVVHGGDCKTQNYVHSHRWDSPVLYLIIQPSDSEICQKGMKNAWYLGCSTVFDSLHVSRYGYGSKIVSVRHGIDSTREAFPYELGAFRKSYIYSKHMIMSAGGFWKHKGMNELVEVFQEVDPPETVLCLFGYANKELAPKETKKVKVFFGLDEYLVRRALCDSDLYVMNSTQEGFGLVLLEAMLNRVPWASRPVGGAPQLTNYGIVYNSREAIARIIENVGNESLSKNQMGATLGVNYKFVKENCMIQNTVTDIERAMGWNS